MTAQTPIILGQAAVWGVPTAYFAGIVTSFGKQNDAEQDKLLDPNGFRITEIFFDNSTDYDIECILNTTGGANVSEPAVASVVAINTSIMCSVQKSSIKWAQKNWAMITFTARFLPNRTLTTGTGFTPPTN